MGPKQPSKKNPALKLTAHHRLPERCGGKTTSENISYVTQDEHNAWNLVFDRGSNERRPKKYVETIAQRLAIYINNYMIGLESCEWFVDEKSERAWNILFGGLTLNEIMNKINSIWLPQTYRLEIVGQVKVRIHEI